MDIRPMSRQERALHSLQAEFMRDAPPGEWFELPGGTHMGARIPDWHDEERNIHFVGNWLSQPLDETG